MSSVFLSIESALQTKLAAVPGAPSIHWENGKTYVPILGTKYWRPTNLPAASTLATTNALQKHQGIYQVDVFVPTDTGLAALFADLDAIYTAFNTVNSLSNAAVTVDIYGVGRGRVVREEAWLHGFIQIEYTCYAY